MTGVISAQSINNTQPAEQPYPCWAGGGTQHKMCRKMNFAPGCSAPKRHGHTKQRDAALLGSSEAAQGKRSARQWPVRLQDAQQCHNGHCAIVPWLPVSPSFCVRKEVKNEKRRKEKNITSKPRGEMENCKTSLATSLPRRARRLDFSRSVGANGRLGEIPGRAFTRWGLLKTGKLLIPPRPAGKLIFFRSSKEPKAESN